MNILLFLVAIFPFLLIFYLMLFRRKSAFLTMPLVYLVSLLIAFFIWGVFTSFIFASFVKGMLIALEITLIIFGAVILLGIYRETKKIEVIKSYITSISCDVRIQVILIAWFFVSFIEGVAGFGTPAALAAPLLVSLGFSPVGAVILSLIGDSTAVSFGASGTPILLGLNSLNLSEIVLNEVILNTAFIHLIVGTFIPLVLVYFVVFVIPKKKGKFLDFYEMIPLAILSGLSFTLPLFLLAKYTGAELPSIVGSLIGFFFITLIVKKGIFVPKRQFKFSNEKIKNRKTGFFKALVVFSPYIVLISGLIISRTSQTVGNFLKSFYFNVGEIFGVNINYYFYPFFSPSIFFFISIIYAAIIFRIDINHIRGIFVNGFEKIERPLISLIFALSFVQLLIFSSNNVLGLKAIPLFVAEFFVELTGKFFIFLSPFVGLLGAFITGSNTISNVLFGSFQSSAALSIGASVALILALQVVGGAIGNMIAIHNILAAEATVKLHGKEGEIIGKTLIVAFIYALVAGIVGFIMFLLV